jgi:hypothetical protein
MSCLLYSNAGNCSGYACGWAYSAMQTYQAQRFMRAFQIINRQPHIKLLLRTIQIPERLILQYFQIQGVVKAFILALRLGCKDANARP